MSHTQEPWSVWGRTASGNKGLLIEDQHGEAIAVVNEGGRDDEEDARRIVVCINACAGITTDLLESKGVAGVNSHLLQSANRIEDLERNNAELLAALIGLVEEKQPLGIDRPAYQTAISLIVRLEEK